MANMQIILFWVFFMRIVWSVKCKKYILEKKWKLKNLTKVSSELF